SLNLPERKIAIPRRSMFAVSGTPGGGGGRVGSRVLDGTWCVSSPRHRCAPRRLTAARRYIHRSDTLRASAFCSLPAAEKSLKFQIPRRTEGEASEGCVGAN
ncbi:hypothetical protein NQZ68_009974, partial [Dissostichus eleginoides]